MARKLVVEIIGDAGSFNKALDSSTGSTNRLGGRLKGLAKSAGFAAIAMTGAAVVIGGKTVSAASDLGEQVAKTGVVFGKSGKDVQKWAESLGTSFGLSQRAALEAAGTYGNMLVPMGFARTEAAGMSKKFVELAADMASFNNASPNETLDALRAGLAGQSEPLRRFGVFLTEARIKSEAAAQGFKEIKGQLDPMAKAAAISSIIMKDTADTQGDFARTSGSLANQQRILRAELENSGAAIGSALLPAVTAAVTGIAKAIPVVTELGGKVAEVLGPALTNLATGFQAAGPAILSVLEALGNVFRENIVPILQQFQEIGTQAITAVSAVIKANGPQLKQIFENLGEVITNIAKIVVPLMKFAFTEVLPVAIKVLIPILVILTEALAGISTVIRVIANVIQSVLLPAFSLVLSVGSTVANFITKTLINAFESAGTPIRTIAGILENVLGGAFRAVTAAAGGVRDAFEWFADKATPIFTKLSKILPGIIGIITAPFEHLRSVMEGILGAIYRMEQAVGRLRDLLGQFGGLVGKLPGLAAGGPVSKGNAYIVGEKGPELFVPGSAGTIVPNVHAPSAASMAGAMGGGSGITINVYGDVTGTEIVEKVRRGLYDIGRRNPGTGLALT